MKIARMAFKEMGHFESVEIKDLSPGLNLLVGPTGSGKSTLRRAIGGIFYGFDDSSRRRMFDDSRLSARGSLELTIGQGRYQLERHRDNWNASADTLRNISSGTSGQSLSRNMGNLVATDYFTFFNFSLIDSPDLERRMVRALAERMGVSSGQTHWSSEAEYLRWRDEAQLRRQRLDSLEAQNRQLVSRRDRLQHELSVAEQSYSQRLADLDRQIEDARSDLALAERRLADAQANLPPIDRQIDALRLEIDRLRAEVIYTEVPAPKSDGLTELYHRLDRIERELKRTRAVQRDISKRRSELRDQRLALSDHEIKARNSSVISARQNISQLEDRIDHLSEVLREVARYDRDHSHDANYSGNDWRELSPAQQFQQAREDLYTLCQDLSRYHLQTTRGRLSAEGRDLRRCAQEMKRRVAWLKMRRQQVLQDILELDPAGYELIQRGEKRFCDCARHAGHLEARKRFLETPVEPQRVAHHHDTSELERQLNELLQRRDSLSADVRQAENDVAKYRDAVQRLLAERQRLLDGLNVDHLRRELREVQAEIEGLERELSDLRARVAKDNPLWNLRYDNLLDQASQLCRQLTAGQVHQIWIERGSDRLSVRDSGDKHRSFDSLSRADQDQVCLSLSLAVAKRMMASGNHVPLVYDDLFVNLDDHRTQATCEVLQQFVASGQQFLLFANGREIDDRFLDNRFQRSHLPQPAVYYLPDLKDESSYQWPLVLVPGVKQRPLALPQPIISTPVVTTKVPAVINEATLIAELDLIERDALAILSDNRILTIANLLDLDPEQLPVSLTSRGISDQRVDRWQSQAWILCCVPGLRPYDARLLVGSGITEPEMLEELDAHDVLARLERYLATNEGQRVMRSGTDYELARVNSWMRSLRDNRSSWSHRDGRQGSSSRYLRRRDRRRRSSQPRAFVQRDYDRDREYDRNGYDRDRQTRESRDREDRNRESRSRESHSRENESRRESVRLHKEREEYASSDSSSLTFYLNRADDLERAPSIGPKMAERFAAIGVHTVDQFLTGDPATMAASLDHRRVDEDTIVAWQHQAKLVCRIPNLRGHDAQLLVARDIIDPETIIGMSAKELYATIVPFSETKEGQKILRSAKAPDMDEINDWIAWAKQHRPLQAA